MKSDKILFRIYFGIILRKKVFHKFKLNSTPINAVANINSNKPGENFIFKRKKTEIVKVIW